MNKDILIWIHFTLCDSSFDMNPALLEPAVIVTLHKPLLLLYSQL